ncbi:MAG: hypothetical protein LBQ60_16560 [Bacteroidales bacterium]|jgi:hypothetical protein|nr:hypothetical protein [Bacteroidales bacterium]
MNAGHYLHKAELLLKRREFEKVVESLEKAILSAKYENDFITLIQSHCFLGEFWLMQGEYMKAKGYLSFVSENSVMAETFDDLLNEEINQSKLLVSLIERYKE